MSATEPSSHVVRVEFRVDADKGTRRTDILAAVRERSKALRLPGDAGCRIDADSVTVGFASLEDTLGAERGW